MQWDEEGNPKIQLTGPKSQCAVPHHGWHGLGSTDRRLWEYESFFAMSFYRILPHPGLPSISRAKFISASGVVMSLLHVVL